MHGVTRSKEITDTLVHMTFTRYWSANYTKVTDVWHSCCGGAVGPKSSTDGGTQHRIEGIILGMFMLLYVKLSISEKSPL